MHSDIIVDPNGDEYVWVMCPVCDGTGIDDDDFVQDACGECDGRGEVREYLTDYDGEPSDG